MFGPIILDLFDLSLHLHWASVVREIGIYIGKVFWTSLIFSSAIIGNFAEAIPIRLKVPFLLRGKSFNILPSCRGATLVFLIYMCRRLFNLKNPTKTYFVIRYQF